MENILWFLNDNQKKYILENKHLFKENIIDYAENDFINSNKNLNHISADWPMITDEYS